MRKQNSRIHSRGRNRVLDLPSSSGWSRLIGNCFLLHWRSKAHKKEIYRFQENHKETNNQTNQQWHLTNQSSTRVRTSTTKPSTDRFNCHPTWTFMRKVSIVWYTLRTVIARMYGAFYDAVRALIISSTAYSTFSLSLFQNPTKKTTVPTRSIPNTDRDVRPVPDTILSICHPKCNLKRTRVTDQSMSGSNQSLTTWRRVEQCKK